MSRVRDPRVRLTFAWALLALCVVGWPLSMVTFARGEPPTVLCLSWAAMIIAALNIVATVDVRKQQEDKDAA